MRTRDQIKFVFCGALFFIVSCSTFTKQITNKTGEIMQNSIASLESYKIGGVQQWVLMRSENINNPILIYLHGGPGSPVIPVVNKYNSELEKKFILVQWEQRGAGKSYKNSIPPETMTIDQFIIDLDELV